MSLQREMGLTVGASEGGDAGEAAAGGGGRKHDPDVRCACDGCDLTGGAAVIQGHQPKKCGLWALGHQPVGQVEGVRGAPWDKRGISWATKTKKPSKKSKKPEKKTKPEYHFEFPDGAGPMCFEHLTKLLTPKGAQLVPIPRSQLDYARRAYIKKYCMKDEPTEDQKREGYFSKDNLPQTVFDCPDGQGGWVHPSHENYQHGPVLSVVEMEKMKFDNGKLIYGKKTTWDTKPSEGEPWPFELEKWQTPPFDKDTAIGMHMCLSDPEYDDRGYQPPAKSAAASATVAAVAVGPSAKQQKQLLEQEQKLRAEAAAEKARREEAEKAAAEQAKQLEGEKKALEIKLAKETAAAVQLRKEKAAPPKTAEELKTIRDGCTNVKNYEGFDTAWKSVQAANKRAAEAENAKQAEAARAAAVEAAKTAEVEAAKAAAEAARAMAEEAAAAARQVAPTGRVVECKTRAQQLLVVEILERQVKVPMTDEDHWPSWKRAAEAEDAGGYTWYHYPTLGSAEQEPKAVLIISKKAGGAFVKVDWIAASKAGQGWGSAALKALRWVVFPPGLKTWRVLALEALGATKKTDKLVKAYDATFEAVCPSKADTETQLEGRVKAMKKATQAAEKLDEDAVEALEEFVRDAALNDNYLMCCSSGHANAQLTHDVGLEPTLQRQREDGAAIDDDTHEVLSHTLDDAMEVDGGSAPSTTAAAVDDPMQQDAPAAAASAAKETGFGDLDLATWKLGDPAINQTAQMRIDYVGRIDPKVPVDVALAGDRSEVIHVKPGEVKLAGIRAERSNIDLIKLDYCPDILSTRVCDLADPSSWRDPVDEIKSRSTCFSRWDGNDRETAEARAQDLNDAGYTLIGQNLRQLVTVVYPEYGNADIELQTFPGLTCSNAHAAVARVRVQDRYRTQWFQVLLAIGAGAGFTIDPAGKFHSPSEPSVSHGNVVPRVMHNAVENALKRLCPGIARDDACEQLAQILNLLQPEQLRLPTPKRPRNNAV